MWQDSTASTFFPDVAGDHVGGASISSSFRTAKTASVGKKRSIGSSSRCQRSLRSGSFSVAKSTFPACRATVEQETALLLRILEAKQKRDAECRERMSHPEDRSALETLIGERDAIPSIVKKSLFDKIDAEEKDVIRLRIEKQQTVYEEELRIEKEKRYRQFVSLFPFISREEVEQIISMNHRDENEAVMQLTRYPAAYLSEARRVLAVVSHPTRSSASASVSSSSSSAATTVNSGPAASDASSGVPSGPSAATSSSSAADGSSAVAQEMTAAASGVATAKNFTPRHQHRKEPRYTKRLSLNDAVKLGDTSQWSAARQKAWLLKDTNSNAYYYRFLNPGEEQKTGKFTEEEGELFMREMTKRNCLIEGRWGDFSRAIPGRVGYQCSSYYRQLIKEGKVKDPNYFFGPEGKLHFAFRTKVGVGRISRENAIAKRQICKQGKQAKKKEGGEGEMATSAAAPVGEETAEAPLKVKSARAKRTKEGPDGKKAPPAKKAKKKGRKRHYDDVIFADEVSDEDSDGAAWASEGKKGGSESIMKCLEDAADQPDQSGGVLAANNPVSDMMDPITMGPLVKPALSPYGHVMSLATWQKVLAERDNRCPFTNKPLKRRDLIVLTLDNIEEHRSKIVPL